MRRHSIAVWFTFGFTFALSAALAGCALPGEDGGGFGSSDDDEDTEGSFSGGNTVVGPPIGTMPPSTGSAGTFGPVAGSSPFGIPGGSAGAGAQPAPPPGWPGFTPLQGLSATCPIAAADDPLTQYGSLATKPCTSGATGCAELVWNGLTPTGSEVGTDPNWDLDVVSDDQGTPTHLIVTRHYGLGTEGSEIVVYELADGAAVAGFRNGAPSTIASFLPALQSSCRVAMVGAPGRVWMVVSDAGSTRVASAPVADLGADLELSAIDVDATVIDGNMIGGPERIALEAEDGQLFLVTTALDVTASYGPDVRVWLTSLAPDGVLVRSQGTNDLAQSYFIMDPAANFTPLLDNVIVAGSDRATLAWLERADDPSVLYLASAGADGSFDVEGAREVPVVNTSDNGVSVSSVPVTFSLVKELQLHDGHVITRGGTGSLDDSAFVLAGDGHVVGEVQLGSTLGGIKSPILALEGDSIWLGSGYQEHGAFPTLQRLEY